MTTVESKEECLWEHDAVAQDGSSFKRISAFRVTVDGNTTSRPAGHNRQYQRSFIQILYDLPMTSDGEPILNEPFKYFHRRTRCDRCWIKGSMSCAHFDQLEDEEIRYH